MNNVFKTITGTVGRAISAIPESRHKQIDRRITKWLSQSGGRLTDDVEREISQQFLDGIQPLSVERPDVGFPSELPVPASEVAAIERPSLRKWPTKITFSPEGDVQVELGNIRRIGILNILDIGSYANTQDGGRVMHFIEFKDGGTCELTYRTDGNLEVFQGHRIRVELIAAEDAVVIGQAERR